MKLNDSRSYRIKTLELLQRPPGRWNELRRLRGAAHVPAVPQDGRRAHEAAVQPAECRAREVQLAYAAQEGRRRPVWSLPPQPWTSLAITIQIAYYNDLYGNSVESF